MSTVKPVGNLENDKRSQLLPPFAPKNLNPFSLLHMFHFSISRVMSSLHIAVKISK
jgi:hypothetical protein